MKALYFAFMLEWKWYWKVDFIKQFILWQVHASMSIIEVSGVVKKTVNPVMLSLQQMQLWPWTSCRLQYLLSSWSQPESHDFLKTSFVFLLLYTIPVLGELVWSVWENLEYKLHHTCHCIQRVLEPHTGYLVIIHGPA